MTEWPPDRRDAADAAIDRAIREIMSAEPRPGLRLRVLARLRDEPRPLLPAWLSPGWPRFAAASLGIAAIVIALLISRSIDRRPEAPAQAQRAPVETAAPPTTQPLEPKRVSNTPPRERSTTTGRPQTADIRRAPAGGEPRMIRAASLPFESLESDPGNRDSEPAADTVRIDRLTAIEPIITAPITIKPLPPIERVAISPLSPPR